MEMDRRTRRISLLVALIFVAVGTTFVSAQQASVAQPEVKSLAGKWVGWGTPPSGGNNIPMQVEIRPDGTYTSTIEARIGTGTIKSEGGKLLAEGHLSGGGSASAGTGKSELSVISKDGKQMIEGAGRNDRGPFNYRLTKQ
jgi:hypothetical protein